MFCTPHIVIRASRSLRDLFSFLHWWFKVSQKIERAQYNENSVFQGHVPTGLISQLHQEYFKIYTIFDY